MPDQTSMWQRIDQLLVQTPSPAAAHHHHVGALVARARRRHDLPVAPELRAAERAAAMSALAAPALLRRVRAAAPGPLLLVKGPEAAASHRPPEARLFKDIDLLTDDVAAVHRALLAAGFAEVDGDWSLPVYHSRPLTWPGVPLTVEIHSAPRHVDGLPAPGLGQLLALARPSRTGVEGVLGLLPSAHAVLLALHAWSHGPLARLGQLIDVAAVLADGDRGEAAALAGEWGCARMWRSTIACVDALLTGDRRPLPTRTWARHLSGVREPSVFESHLADIVASAWAQPPARAGRGIGRALLATALARDDDTWAQKRHRARRAMRNAFMPMSDYRTLP